jgi:hypothetical protein
MEITDTSPATTSTASLYTLGGISIFSTADSNGSSGSFLTLGGVTINKSVLIGGTTQMTSTTASTNTSNGALIISGGAGISGNLYGNFSSFQNIQAFIGASIPNLVTSNISSSSISVTTFNPANITTNNLYITNTATAQNLVVSNFSTNSLYINSGVAQNVPTIFGYNTANTTATGLAFSSWNGTSFTEKARFDSVGNFLINTTQPGNSNTLYFNCLSAAGSDGGIFDTQFAINPIIGFAVQGSRKYTFGIDSSDSYKFKFNRGLFNAQVNTMTLDQSGNVGIGTAVPTRLLDVSGGNAQITGDVTTGSLFTPLATIGNIFSTNITSSNLLLSSNLTASSAVFTSTTVSNGLSTGSIITVGGVAVNGNLNVGGNTVIAGNLTVNGTSITINSTNTSYTDNILQLNYNPGGLADTGLLLNRYQVSNNAGSGDVVSDTIAFTGIAQNISNTTTIVFPSGASTVTGFYNNFWIKFTSGANNNQVRQIASYNGTTLTATMVTAFGNNPSGGIDTFNVYGNVYAVNYFNEVQDTFVLGFTNLTFGNLVNLTNYANLRVQNLISVLVTTNNLLATNATLTNINLTAVNLSNLTTTNFVTTNETVTSLVIGNQTVTSSFINNATASNIFLTNSTLNNTLISFGTFGSLVGNNLTIGNLNAIGPSNLSGGLVQTINLTGTNATISTIVNTNLSSSNAYIINETATNILNTNLTTSSLFINGSATITNTLTTNLQNATNSFIGTLTSTNANLVNSTATNAFILNGNITNLTFGNFNGSNGTMTNLLATTLISTNNLSANFGSFNSVTIGNEIVTNETVGSLFSTNVNSTNITANTLISFNNNVTNQTVTNLVSNFNTDSNLIVIGTQNVLYSIITNQRLRTLAPRAAGCRCSARRAPRRAAVKRWCHRGGGRCQIDGA